MTQLMMPRATAVWLIDNTALTFMQIANFCSLHELEVQAIADGEVNGGMAGMDPLQNSQLTAEEIKRCEADPTTSLELLKTDMPEPIKRAKGARYTPISKRQDKPDGIAWLLKNHPELTDAQVGRLLGTTKSTITAVRERTHWNTSNIRARDPVDIGLCTYVDLYAAVEKARAKLKKDGKTPEDAASGAPHYPAPEVPESADTPAQDPYAQFLGTGKDD